MSTNDTNDWIQCVCDGLADFCGALSPCAIPGLIEAIKDHDWLKAATLVISAGECAAEIEVIIPVLAFASISCLFRAEGVPLSDKQLAVLDQRIKEKAGEKSGRKK